MAPGSAASPEQELPGGPLYVSTPWSPWSTQSSFQAEIGVQRKDSLESQLSTESGPYSPGEMLAETAGLGEPAFMMGGSLAFGGELAFGDSLGASLRNESMCAATAIPTGTNDAGAESDCSTVDTTDEVGPALLMTPSDASTPGSSSDLIPNLGLLTELPETPWPEYSMPYWMHNPYAQPWPAMNSLSKGSDQHASGRCKPCAFLYKEGCRSGAQCQYCHLCPPGEKQRRKRVLRSIQRNIVGVAMP